MEKKGSYQLINALHKVHTNRVLNDHCVFTWLTQQKEMKCIGRERENVIHWLRYLNTIWRAASFAPFRSPAVVTYAFSHGPPVEWKLLNDRMSQDRRLSIYLGTHLDGFYYLLNENRFNHIIVKVGKNRFNIKFCILNNYIASFKNRVRRYHFHHNSYFQQQKLSINMENW